MFAYVWYPNLQDAYGKKEDAEAVRHFLNCLQGKEKPNHSLHDAKRVLEIALQAKQQLELDDL